MMYLVMGSYLLLLFSLHEGQVHGRSDKVEILSYDGDSDGYFRKVA
jgi:hypothetical protein